MSQKDFKSFLNTVSDKIHPLDKVHISAPESPPDWDRLGWKVGWIIQEAYTGLQWWLAGEDDWEKLTAKLGNSRQQKTQTFINWYTKTLKSLGREKGLPIKLESVRWRRVDLEAIVDRPRIQDETWWEVSIGEDAFGNWNLILPQRFYHIFEEEEATERAKVKPPWDFTELWGKLDRRARRKLLELIGPRRGLRNHLASLIVGGALEAAEVVGQLPDRPTEELQETLGERRQMLEKQSNRQRQQTLNQWTEDARFYLTEKVGEWLEDETLKGPQWKKFSAEWNQFRIKQLKDKFERKQWTDLWENLSTADLKQLVPRLNFDQLGVASVKLPESQRNRICECLSSRKQEEFKKLSGREPDLGKVLKARRDIYKRARELLENQDFELDGEFEL